MTNTTNKIVDKSMSHYDSETILTQKNITATQMVKHMVCNSSTTVH